MQKNWVDFQLVKQAVTMRMVLEHYAIGNLRKRGEELRGRCPIHEGEGANTFHVSLNKNAFHCFSCHAKGNVLDFVAAMEDSTVRDAGLKLTEWFKLGTSDGTSRTATRTLQNQRATEEEVGESEQKNQPLKFQLRGIDSSHSYLASRGITKKTAERFGVGFFSGKGSMAGRIVLPIHNGNGELVAYAGRSLDDSEPKYKFPAGFHKALELFNFHRLLKEIEAWRPVVLVEGFFDCMKIDQEGFPVVALMGCSLSEFQEQLLVSEFERIVVLLDGDEAGRAAAEETSNRLKRKLFVRVVELPEGKQPDQLSTEEIKALLQDCNGRLLPE